MLKDIRLTLYDIFGYLLPGIVFLIAAGLFLWTLAYRDVQISIPSLSPEFWIIVLLLAYFLGHVAQGIGNITPWNLLSMNDAGLLTPGKVKASLPESIVTRARDKAAKLVGLSEETIDPNWLYRICDGELVYSGHTNIRDMLQYREGFYRGMTVSFFVLAVATLCRCLFGSASVLLGSTPHTIAKGAIFFLFLASLLVSLIGLYRYRRFSIFRVRHAILGFLLLPKRLPVAEPNGTAETENKRTIG